MYIVCTDRWLPWVMDWKYEEYAETFRMMFDPDVEVDMTGAAGELPIADTANADYVWPPLQFDGDKVQIIWRDSWRIEDFE